MLIVIDACYSGKWVDRLSRLNRSDISVQASCGPEQTSMDNLDGNGGILISNFIKINKNKNINLNEKQLRQELVSHGCYFTVKHILI